MKKFKQWFAFLMLALMAAGAQAAAMDAPDQIVRAISRDVLNIIKKNDKDTNKVRDLVDARIAPLADYTRMTKLAVGRHWRTATPEQQQRWLLPLLSAVLVVSVLVMQGDLAQASALPILPAMALLAAGGVPSLRRGAANALDWFSLMSLATFGILVWLAWSAQWGGWPPGLARHVARNAPDFVLSDPGFQAAVGAVITVIWIALLWKLPRSSSRAPANWAIGLTMLWCLAVVLWQPWFAHTKNYQPVAGELRKVLSAQPAGCISRQGLADTQRAALDYFADIRTVSDKTEAAKGCPLHLSYAVGANSKKLKEDGTLIWERRLGGGRKAEVFRLYRRG